MSQAYVGSDWRDDDPRGVIGIESSLRTSPMCLISCITFPALIAAARRGPLLKNALYITPVPAIVGNRFTDCVFNPLAGIAFQRSHQLLRDNRGEQSDVLLVEPENGGTFRLDTRRMITLPQFARRKRAPHHHLLDVQPSVLGGETIPDQFVR